eukprot:3933430-Rhodomonas_salina.4
MLAAVESSDVLLQRRHACLHGRHNVIDSTTASIERIQNTAVQNCVLEQHHHQQARKTPVSPAAKQTETADVLQASADGSFAGTV